MSKSQKGRSFSSRWERVTSVAYWAICRSCFGGPTNTAKPLVPTVPTVMPAACAVTLDGAVKCWGTSGSVVALDAPTEDEIYECVDISQYFACALRRDGMVDCWGTDGTGATMTAPPNTFEFFSCGSGHCCGLRTNGHLACWGGAGGSQGAPGTSWQRSGTEYGVAVRRATDHAHARP